MDLRKLNTPFADDYTTINHPVTICQLRHNTWQGILFCKRDCSRANRCLQIFIKVSGNACIQFCWQTKDLHKVSGDLCLSFFSFMRENLDPVVNADQYRQSLDVIGNAGNNATALIWKTRAVITCFRTAGLKLTIKRRYFGVR